MNEKKNGGRYADTLLLLIGEVIVAALISIVYLIIGRFDYTVPLGALVGGGVMVLNLFILSYSVNRAVDKFIAERGDRELDEEEAAEYAAKFGNETRMAVAKSQLLRNLLMIGVLAAALISKQCDIIATVIPLLMYRPLLSIGEYFRKKRGV